ncbi:hypothetical protein C8N35_11095 [Breoghania corrubedonensis]|uniref:HdeA/HdeB family protein n=1 Tax=Breoghania corrubedonensis TaxID=665038 RepID=A0A2T5V1K5_9HYPH|nr:hypothetical protein [Breoghania corrubedonensis]PTW57616.1 hypothetical protein C8N35_11095 [Breoghania corrubedonensis]
MIRTAVPLLVLLLLAGVLAPSGAVAARPDTRAMTCAQAQTFVRRHGAVVMTTGRHTFQRIVSHQRYCDRWQQLFPELAPTRDNPQCVVGYRCDEPLFSPFFD